MQALYMIFWKTDSQLTHILVDTEPFSSPKFYTPATHLYCFSTGAFPRQVTAWPDSWPQREHVAGHLQEMGRSKLTHPGWESSVITAGSSFPFLRGTYFFRLASTLNHRTWRVPLLRSNPKTGIMHCNLCIPSAGTATPAYPSHRNYKHSAIHTGTNQSWRYQPSWSWQKILKASETLP